MRVLMVQRRFALLWVAAVLSGVGDYMLLIALPFTVYERTGSTLSTGAMVLAETVPAVVLGSVAGVYVDRWDRRQTMIGTDVARALVLLVLLSLGMGGPLWVAFVVVAIQASLSQFFAPASGALLPRVVAADQLMAANSLRAIADNLARVVGPAVGGVAVGVVGLSGVVLVDVGSFLLSAGLLVLLHVPPDPALPTSHPTTVPPLSFLARWNIFWQDWRDGLRLVRRDPVLTALFVLWDLTMLAQGIMSALWVPFVQGTLQGNAVLFGAIATAQGIGGIAGGFLVGESPARAQPRRRLALSGLAVGLLFLAMISVRAPTLILVLSAGLGVPVLIFDVGVETALQRAVVDGYRGRVLGAFAALGALVMLFGVLLGSIGGIVLGVLPLLDLAGGLLVLSGVLALVLLPHADAQDSTTY